MNRLLMIVLLVCGILWAGCHKDEAKHYPVSGEVISVDVPHQMIMLKHGDIPGLMPAMTMDYKVSDVKQIEGLKAGDMISADLVVGANIGHLEKIVVTAKAATPAQPATPVK
ncbi:MAG TPA: copper-binding protein [Candidatus Acidoferrum sp.]|jgi:protein SCO1/2